MGCDIHLVVQAKINGIWQDLKAPESMKDEYDIKMGCDANWHIRRNYLFFSILAGVRGPLELIVPRRGFPADFTIVDEYGSEAYHNGKWMGDHCFTWLTLQEILDYDWN